MRQWLLISWVLIATGVMAGLVILTFPAKPLVASPPPTVSVAKPGCYFGITRDVNNCGVWTIFFCNLLNSAPAPGHGQQCEICRIWQIQIQGRQVELKLWYDCTYDNHPDCEIWWAEFQLKGCRFGGTTSVPDPLAAESVECMCPIDAEI